MKAERGTKGAKTFDANFANSHTFSNPARAKQQSKDRLGPVGRAYSRAEDVTPNPAFDLEQFIIYRCVVGSRAYGLDNDESDTDRRDIVSHDVKKFFGLLLKKNGYVLEQLFSPLIVHTTPEHAELMEICRARLHDRSSRGNEAHSSSGKSQSLLTSAATGVITKHHSHLALHMA